MTEEKKKVSINKKAPINNVSKKIMVLMEEKGQEVAWSKKELLTQTARWQEEFAAETKRLSQISNDKAFNLASASLFLTGFTDRQKNRQKEIADWQTKVSNLEKNRRSVENELSKILTEVVKG